ncbi:aspartate aminotransferase family protein [Candidatus Parcubacteria bacterium]|nr:MAG: aspartate aminotransferase family protein [Candidatus Parcubacteria bacterium]
MIENSIVYRDFKNKYEYLPISRAEGSLIWDRKGKRYIDFTSSWNVTNLGWNHPEVNEAVIAQAKKNVQGLLWGSDPIQEEYALALTAALPKGLDACAKATGGTEAVEMAVKIARVYTGRKKIVGFREHYHGQLFASLALGAPWEMREKIAPLVPEIAPIAFPHEGVGSEGFGKFAEEFENLLSKKDVAAVVTEPGIVTGWGSTLVAHPGFLAKVRELTEKYGTLLVVDEVGTGFSRTGKLFGIEHENVVPDMVVLAKGISNGAAAIGTVVGRSEVFEPAFTDAVLVSTFGWTPVACAAALKTLQVHQRDKVWEMAEKKGAYIMGKLKAHIGGKVVAVRGKGMEMGVQFKDARTAEQVQKAAFADGLHIVLGSGDNIQLMPPLTIPQELLDEGLEILVSHLAG